MSTESYAQDVPLVASQSAPRRGVAAVVAALMFIAIAPTPAQAQTNVLIDIAIDPGTVRVADTSASVAHFVGNESITVSTKVFNRGSGAASGIPVLFFIQGQSNVPDKCYASVALAAGANVTLTWTFDTTVLPSGPHHVVAQANLDAPSGHLACGTKRGATDTATDNLAYGYFVKDRVVNYAVNGVRWCVGIPSDGALPPVCNQTVDNQTRYAGQGSTESYFGIDIINNGSWQDVTDYGRACVGNAQTAADCPRFDYELEVKLSGPFLPAPLYITPTRSNRYANTSSTTGDWWHTQVFDLVGKAGNYTVDVTFNPNGTFDDGSPKDDHNASRFEVRYGELFSGAVTGFRTNQSAPYPFTAGTAVWGNITINNTGPLALASVGYSIRIDDLYPHFVVNGSRANVDRRSSFVVEFKKTIGTTPGNTEYLAPGAHTLYVTVDPSDDITEPNEANNVRTLEIFVQDASLPVITNAPHIAEGSTSAPAITLTRPNKEFLVHATVQDQDQDSLKVVANFTSQDNASHSRLITLRPFPTPADPYHFAEQVLDFDFYGNGSTSAWSVRVEATDAFNNTAKSVSKTLTLEKWALHTVPEDYLVLGFANGSRFDWASTLDPTVTIQQHANMTGFPGDSDEGTDEFTHNYTGNLMLHVTTPLNVSYHFNGTHWTARTHCNVPPDDNKATPPVPGSPLPGDPAPLCTDIGNFTIPILKSLDGGAPGQWNISIEINDRANATPRYVNRTYFLIDNPPAYLVNLMSVSGANIPASQGAFVPAGAIVNFTSRITDDFEVEQAYANITRASDGVWSNYTFPGHKDPTATGGVYHEFILNLTTGRGKMLGLAGNFTVDFHAVDSNDNWAHAPLRFLNISDPNRPAIISAGVVPPLQEVRSNVTFYAIVEDETNVTVTLSVLSGSQYLRQDVPLVQGFDGNYTYTTNFSVEGNYEWVITALDSVRAASSPDRRGPILIRDNLGPRFDIRSPGGMVDGERFGQASPRLDILVYDVDGVDADTVTFQVDGVNATGFDIVPSPTGQLGYILTFSEPGKKYLHGATVTVNLSAIDNSTRKLPGFSNFTFRIDDVAPIAKVESFEPSHRDSEEHFWNVSRETRFTLVATDDDALPTKVDNIRYRVYGPTPSIAETVYTAPFKITDATGPDARPGLYQIQFFAEDTVGNVHKTVQTITVYLDDTPPSQDPFGAEPRGRYVNMSFIDDKAGMDRAVVWHKTNNGTYGATTMELSAGVWRAVLPEGRKGDRISYYLQAWDRVDNTLRIGSPDEPYRTFLVENHEPAIKILSPLQGDIRGRRFDVTWQASDADNDALIFDLSLKSPGATAFSEIIRIENPETRAFPFDSTKYPDGDYTFRIRATDGTAGATADAQFAIRNSVGAVGVVNAAKRQLEPGETTLLTVVITKATTLAVEAHIFRDGTFVTAFAMHDDGADGDVDASDGTFSALIGVDEPGDYRVDILTRYREDGVEKNTTATGVASFSVALTPGYVFTTYMPLIVLLAVAAIAAVAIAAVVILRRR